MNSKQIWYNVFVLAAGIIVGFILGSSSPNDETHMMPDGTMMHGSHMTMEDMMHDMNAGLVGKTGDAFDQAFLEEMIVHHQGAVEMAELVLQTSKRPELTALANDIITAQTKEIAMMQGWLDTWFGK